MFIDPFGFSNTPFASIERILSNEKSEVLINFMYEEINRFISHPGLPDNYSALFGTAEWKTVQAIEGPDERRRAIHDIYLRQLRKAAKYVRSFEMLNHRNRTDYFLFFASNALKGLEKMKEAMWAIDKTGTYQFSDYTDSLKQRPLFREQPDYADLQSRMTAKFRGKQISIEDLGDWVVSDTPYLRTHVKTNVLKPMESVGKLLLVNAKATRRKGTFPDGSILRFL
jgi:hypothetical protein